MLLTLNKCLVRYNGTNGTDLTSTLTTQGDLLYRDGSGLVRLGAGTAGQALITGGLVLILRGVMQVVEKFQVIQHMQLCMM
jgi:hypothetical protein